MKSFIQRLSVFIFLICAIGTVIVVFLSRCGNNDKCLSHEAVFVWGDSQTYQGLDLCQLSKTIGQKVYSSACHGAGVYDFLVFADKVPDSSTVVISFPECALFRNPKSDSNRSGLNWVALKTLFYSGYQISELLTIAKQNNYSAKNIFYAGSTHLYEYADTITFSEPLDGFVNMYYKKDHYIDKKIEAYGQGIEILVSKKCNISLISFPFDNKLEKLIKHSPCRIKSDSISSLLISKYGLNEIELPLQEDSLLMYDLSHMNKVGARRLTTILAQSILADGDKYYDVTLQ